MSLFALLASSTHSVYKYFEHRTLNLVRVPVFLILTLRASLRRAVRRKSLISLICLGCVCVREDGWQERNGKTRVWVVRVRSGPSLGGTHARGGAKEKHREPRTEKPRK